VIPDRQMLITYRLERARETLEEARVLLEKGHANAGVNRLYYACFYAVSALLLTRDTMICCSIAATKATTKILPSAQ
jgi:uncharacterized protein (UPF0332 family)